MYKMDDGNTPTLVLFSFLQSILYSNFFLQHLFIHQLLRYIMVTDKCVKQYIYILL